MKKVLLKIDGMTCSACSSGLEKYLNKQDGIKQANVNLVMNNANIEYVTDGFTHADRKTDVEIAIVKMDIEQKESTISETSFFDNL